MERTAFFFLEVEKASEAARRATLTTHTVANRGRVSVNDDVDDRATGPAEVGPGDSTPLHAATHTVRAIDVHRGHSGQCTAW